MSVQFGRWKFDGEADTLEYLEKVETLLVPYGPDRGGSYLQGGVNILYRGFHTTEEAERAKQPHLSQSGAVTTWDGRLDNRAELIRQLEGELSVDSTDVSIVAAAYERWKNECFSHLIGDWAISIWDPIRQVLILAKDPIGTRPLYYSVDGVEIVWSTILEPLVVFADRGFALNEEYLAGCLAFYPAAHLTPYVGIHSVPPSSYAHLARGIHKTVKYWEFDPANEIRYRTDAEYEEHFRAVFEESVRRRLRSKFPILAELSGGMDSSSIVCIADKIIARETVETPRLDTVSYYDDSEPNWNERPYFTSVEKKRACTGCHIDVSSQETFAFQFDAKRFTPTPGSAGRPTEACRQFAACIRSMGNRVVLSGIGGDEVLGGVPTPMPELRDLIAGARFKGLAHQLKAWALNKRKPWLLLLFEAVQGFLPPALVGAPKYRRPAPWLNPDFVTRNRSALAGYEDRLRLFGRPPSLQENLGTLDGLRRQFAFSDLPSEPLYEKRYPYLDIDLLEFIYAIPREQLVRPGHRRSLMRRALAGIVPNEIINRRRKAFPARTPMMAISAEWTRLIEAKQQLLSSVLGIVDAKCFLNTLEKSRRGQEISMVQVMRTLAVEAWLSAVNDWTTGQSDETKSNPALQSLTQGSRASSATL